MRILRLALLLALAFPAAAQAQEATIVSRDVPLAGQRTLASTQPPARFDLVGLHWRGSGSVRFRTRSVGGRWSVWNDAAPEDDKPDARTAERAARSTWRLGNPWWVGASDRIEYRLRGRVTRLRAYFVRSPAAAVPARTLQRAAAPAIVPRKGWDADEKIKRSGPSYATAIRFSVVHHTAGSNGYTAAQAPAIVRAIQLYHVKGNGWNDIGYNFLVDKYGQVYEGRYGGIDRNVVGAHAEGFNTGSVGVAVLGEYGSLAVTGKAKDALARLLAWRLDQAHVDPASTVNFPSAGNARFPSGVPVFLRAVSGHRDTGFTDCPGTALYNLLNGIAGNVREIGLPKLFAPVVTGAVPGKVRFRARLSEPLDWAVDIVRGSTRVASSTGYGAQVDWTWDAAKQPPGAYRYEITSSSDLTPAVGTIGAAAAPDAPPAGELALTGVAADPETVTPNADGAGDTSTITYTLSQPANVTATVTNAQAAVVFTYPKTWKRAAEHTLTFDPNALPDGIYTLTLTAAGTGGRTATGSVVIAVSRTLGAFTATPRAFSPNGDNRADALDFAFTLSAPAAVRLRVLRGGKWVATPFEGPLGAGPQTLSWDGSRSAGRLRDGDYEAVLEATDALGTARVVFPFAADTTPPKLKILSRAPLRVTTTEPAKLRIRAAGRNLVRAVAKAGTVTIPGAGRTGLVRVVGWDAAGNVSTPVSRR